MKVQLLLLTAQIVACLANTDPKGHLQPFGSSGTTENLPVDQDNVLPDHLAQKHFGASEPSIIVGAIKSLPVFTKWTTEYLKSKTPNSPDGLVRVDRSRNLDPKTRPEFVKLAELLDRKIEGEIYRVNYLPVHLKSEVQIPKFLSCPTLYKEIEEIAMWHGGANAKSLPMSFNHEEIVCSLRGNIEIIATISFEDFKAFTQVHDDGLWFVDPEKMNLVEYPFLSNLTFYKGTMKPGDCVVIPSNWVYQIHSITPSLTLNYVLPSFALLQDKAGDGKCATQDMPEGATVGDGIVAEANRTYITEYVKKVIQALVEESTEKESPLDQAAFVKILTSHKDDTAQYAKDVAASLFVILDINRNGQLDTQDIAALEGSMENYGLFKKYYNLWNAMHTTNIHLFQLPELNKHLDDSQYRQPYADDDDELDDDDQDDSGSTPHDEL